MADRSGDTPLRQLASVLLGAEGPVEAFIRKRREDGLAWRLVVRELWEATDGQIDITHETARAWSPDPHAKAS